MAARKRGNGEIHDLTIEVLKSIRKELTGLREDISKLRDDTNRGFEGVSKRIDHLVEFSGERWRNHEARLTRIEKQLKKG